MDPANEHSPFLQLTLINKIAANTTNFEEFEELQTLAQTIIRENYNIIFPFQEVISEPTTPTSMIEN